MNGSQCKLSLAVAGIALVVFASLMLVPDFFKPPGTDYGVYFNAGRLITEGKIPYRDFWDHKTPGIYVYSAAWQLVFGSGWHSAIAALIPVYGLFAISIYAFHTTVFGGRWESLLTALIGAYLALRLGFDPSRNGVILALSTSLELFALALIFRLRESGGTGYRAYGVVSAGVLAALAPLVRQASIVPLVIILPWLAWRTWISGGKPGLKQAAVFLLSFVAGAGMVAVILAVAIVVTRVDLSDTYRQVVEYNLFYRRYLGATVSSGIDLIRRWVDLVIPPNTYTAWWIAALAGIVYIFPFITKRVGVGTNILNWSTENWTFSYLCLGAATVVTIVATGAKGYYHLQYLPYLAILTVAVLLRGSKELLTRVSIPRLSIMMIIVGFFIILLRSTFLSDYHMTQNWYSLARSHDFRVSSLPDQTIAKEIQPLLGPNDTIFVYGYRDWIYILTDTVSPTRYYSGHMFDRWYQTAEEFEATIRLFESNLPKVIVAWASVPNPGSPEYISDYVVRFDQLLAERYSLYLDMSVPGRKGFTSPEPVRIYVQKARLQ